MWLGVYFHSCVFKVQDKKATRGHSCHAFKSGRVPEVNISLRPRKKPVMYKVFKWEPFRTTLAFRVTQVFNFDLCKSLPLLAAGKGQRGHFEVKKQKFLGQVWKPKSQLPLWFWP